MIKLKASEQDLAIYFLSSDRAFVEWAKEFYDFIEEKGIDRITIKGKTIDIEVIILGRGFKKDLSRNLVEVEIKIDRHS